MIGYREELRRFEHDLVLKYLELAWGNIAEAARLSGLRRSYFRDLVERHNIDPKVFVRARTA